MSQNHQNQWIASFVWMIALAGIAMTASVAQANKNADSPAVNNTNASSGVAAPVKNLTGYANPAGDIPASWLNFGGKPNDVDWKAQWIWMDGPANPRNFYLCARRDFEVPSTKASSQEPWRLHISADSRYRLYVNDEWIGDGPARSFYWAQQYDTYDLADKIKPGETNTIAVLVSHYGEGTFQYNPSGQGGLLVQLEQKKGNQWKPQLITDKSWLVAPHEGYLRPTMRVSCQMPFEEIVDGRLMPFWMASQERLARLEHNGRKQDLSMFRPAKVLGPVGSGPWTTMVGRTVPFFTKDYVKPTRVFKTQLVRMPNFHTGFTTRPYLLPGYFMQNTKELKGFAATIIESPVEQTIRIPQHTWNFEEPIINGEWAGNKKAITLHQGPNLCVIPFRPGKTHEFDRSYCAFIEQPITLKGVFNDETAWTIFGPFGDDYQSIYDRVTKIKTVNELEEFKAKAQVVKAEDILTNGSAWDESTAAEAIAGEARVEQEMTEAEKLDEIEIPPVPFTTVHPSKEGDTEIWYDFGKELVGYLIFGIKAPEGAVLTFNFFEEIEDGERVHYTFGNYNAMRYTTRDGLQTFTTFLRRGYRYCKVTVSHATGPVEFIRDIQTVFATHPAPEMGQFECSDELLNKIWDIGRHTLRCCSEDTYTDCPAYEQSYWVGDGRNEAMVDYAAFGNLALSRRCAELPAVSLGRQLLTESQVPSAWDNLLTAWSLLWVQMTEEHYQFSGDKQYLAGIYPAVDRMLRNIRQHYTDEHGLLAIHAWNLFDWAGQDNGHDVVTHNQMFLVEALRRAEYMARELGKTNEAKYWADYRQELVAAINKHLWNDEKNAYVDAIHADGKQSQVVSQQTNSLALLYGVAPPERASKIHNAPDAPPPGMVTVGSPFALFYMLDALVQEGRHAEAMAIIRKRWGEMVGHGATTFWETFPGFDAKWWTRSYCHAWSAAPTYFLSRYQLGAWWDQPGYKVARIAPVPLDLTWAHGAVPTPHGPIEVDWKKSDDRFIIEVKLPNKVAGIVELPVSANELTKLVIRQDTAQGKATASTTSIGEGTKAELLDINVRQINGKWQLNLPTGTKAIIEAAKPGTAGAKAE